MKLFLGRLKARWANNAKRIVRLYNDLVGNFPSLGSNTYLRSDLEVVLRPYGCDGEAMVAAVLAIYRNVVVALLRMPLRT